MAQTNFTPISLYYSSTATNVPTAGNLVAGELAINTADGKLFYKDSAGVVQTIATKNAAAGTYSSITTNQLTIGTTQLGAGDSSMLKNRIINGAMVIDQRNAGALVNPAVTQNYYLDRYFVNSTVAGKFSIGQNAGAVTPPAGFTNYLGITSLSAYTVGASELFAINQRIEGYNVADLGWGTANAKTVTLSFWVYSSLTGTFGGALRNSAASRSYPYSYTITAANTWEYKTITVAGDTTGTWLTTNGVGINVTFSLGVGSTFSGTAGAWAGTNYASATGATSVVGTNGATFYITGVQLEVGTQATSFEYRQYGTELALCQRYYYGYVSSGGKLVGRGGYYSSTQVEAAIFFPVTMRTTPTLVATSGTNFYVAYRNGGGDDLNSLTLSNEGSAASVSVFNNSEASGTGGDAAQIATNNASASVAFNAEL
jgi:hypothetical protein